MKKLFASLILGLLVLGLTPFGMMDAYAQSTLYGIAGTGGGTSSISTFYTIDIGSGAVQPVGLVGFTGCDAMDIDQSGTIYATCNRTGTTTNVLITINPLTGAGTEIGPTGVGISAGNTGPKDMSFRNSDGILFGYTRDCGLGFNLMTIDLMNGPATQLGGTGTCHSGNGLAFTPGDILKLHITGTFAELYDVNHLNGLLTNLVLTTNVVSAMDYNPDDGLLYASDGGGGSSTRNLVTIDTVTGVKTIIGPTVDRLTALAFQPDSEAIGGEISQLNYTALIVAGIQSSAVWMIPVVISAIGMGLVLVRKHN